jgi:predicted nuclease of predicted toxin-antitoxin system
MIWIDAQLSPYLAPWLKESFGLEAQAVRDLGLREADDREIHQSARAEKVIVMTKDSDFVVLLDELGPPPQILWITCGNTSNEFLKNVLQHTLPEALSLLKQGEPLVEIRS